MLKNNLLKIFKTKSTKNFTFYIIKSQVNLISKNKHIGFKNKIKK